MWENIGIDKCKTFIERYATLKSKEAEASKAHQKPAITIAREEGAGGLTVASELAGYLKEHIPSHEEWGVFSHQLVVKVLEEQRLNKNVADFMKEKHKRMVSDAIEEILGLHPSTYTFVQKTNATILRLAQMGNVILVGRGANIITSKLENTFHVYLVGSLEKRIGQAMKVFGYDRKTAADYIKKKDKERKRYIKDNFDKDINDPMLYHITINTDFMGHEDAAGMIGNEVIRRFNLGSPEKATAGRSL